MKNNSKSKLLFDARDEKIQNFDFSYTEKINMLEKDKKHTEKLLVAEKEKIENLQKLISKLNKEKPDGIYKKRMQESQQSIETLQEQIANIENMIEQYRFIKSPDSRESINIYIQKKKQSIKNIMTLEQERKLQISNAINQSIEESEQRIKELFDRDQELINQIQEDKALLLAEKEYKIGDKAKQTIQSYEKLIQAWESSPEKIHQEVIGEDLTLKQRIKNIYTNIVKDYKFFAYLRNPEILEKFLKEINKNTGIAQEGGIIALTEFSVDKRYEKKDKKSVSRKEFIKVDNLLKTFNRMAGSNRGNIGLLPNKGSKVDVSRIEDFLRGHITYDQIDPDQNIDSEEAAFELIAKNMSVDLHILNAADDYIKAINALPNQIEADKIFPYIQEIESIAEQLGNEKSKFNHGEIYEIYLDTFEKHASFFNEYIISATKRVHVKCRYIIIPLLTEILIETASIAIGRHTGGKWSGKGASGNIDTFFSLRTQIVCEESVIESTSHNAEQHRLKINNGKRMLHLMNGQLKNDKTMIENALRNSAGEEKGKIEKLMNIQERDIYANETFLWYYNYFTGANNIHNIYNIIFKTDGEGNNFSETQRAKVADLYFQNIDWTEVPYDDPMALMPDQFLLQKTKNDYAFETNKSPDEKYHAIIKIGDFEAFAQDEHSLNIAKKIMKTTYRESKIDEIASRIVYQDDHLIIKNFLNYAIAFVHNDGSLSINGHNSDSIGVLIGNQEYNILRAYIFKYLLESNNRIDKRNVLGPEQLLPKVPDNADDNFRRTDPRVVYGHDKEQNTGATKALDFRDDHKRLLSANMFPGTKGFNNAKQYQQNLYAHIYNIGDDPELVRPKEKIRIDHFDNYEDMFRFCKAIREEHTTNTTIVRFETYVQEFAKNGEVERIGKMHYIGRGVGEQIQNTLNTEPIVHT